MRRQPGDDSGGCFILLTVAMISLGAGMIWGAGWAFLTAGLMMLILLVAMLFFNRGRR